MFIYVLDYNSEVTGAIRDLHIPIRVGISGPFLSCKLNIIYLTCPRKQKFLRGKMQINKRLNYFFGSSNVKHANRFPPGNQVQLPLDYCYRIIASTN